VKIRHWKLGSLEHKVFPTLQGIEDFEKKVKEQFKDDKSDTIDIVTGAEVELNVFEIEE